MSKFKQQLSIKVRWLNFLMGSTFCFTKSKKLNESNFNLKNCVAGWRKKIKTSKIKIFETILKRIKTKDL